MNIKEIALELAHRKCTKYDHIQTDMGVRYGFSDSHIVDFAEALIAEVQRQNEPVGFVDPYVVRDLTRGVRYGGARISPRLDVENGPTFPLFAFPPSIESEREKVAELEAEIERLKNNTKIGYDQVVADLRADLAAEQLRNERLREALSAALFTMEEVWQNGIDCLSSSDLSEAKEAISEPHDTAALDAYVEQKVKEAGK